MKTLVPFAGDDRQPRRKPSAYTLFLLGYDTVEIAERLGVKEHVASRMVHEERCARRGLPVEYERRPSA